MRENLQLVDFVLILLQQGIIKAVSKNQEKKCELKT